MRFLPQYQLSRRDHAPPSRTRWRSDIDGLRGIAVLSVVIFHGFPNLLPGGFTGVDVFFVISGYLISTIIIEGLQGETFSFREFYARRIRRIFPALILVLGACLVIGWNLLLPDELEQMGKHAAAGIGFVSNLVLLSESGYFDTASELKPLLHLWSLGIEEQFYIAWPLVLWLAWRVGLSLVAVAACLALASFALNVWGIASTPVETFYLPQTRAWELLAGALLAALQLTYWRSPLTQKASDLISLVGFIAIVAGFLLISNASSFPGWWALMPVSGAALMIGAGPAAIANRAFLSNRLLVWFGLISFPLYLWHWPILSFARIMASGVPQWPVRLSCMVLAIFLSWFTYVLVEKPIRFGVRRAAVVPTLAAFAIALGGLGVAVFSLNGIASREVVVANVILNSGSISQIKDFLKPGCAIADEKDRKLFHSCVQDNRPTVKYALLGDSKAGALFAGLISTSGPSGRWMLVGGTGHQGPIPLLSDDPQFARYQLRTQTALQWIAKDPNVEVVLIAASIRSLLQISDGIKNRNYSDYDYKYMRHVPNSRHFERTSAGLKNFVGPLVRAGKRVMLLVDNPALPDPRDCTPRVTAIPALNELLKPNNSDCFVPLDLFETQIQRYIQLLDGVRAAYDGSVEIVDATDTYCDVSIGICGPVRNGRLLYSYTDHISEYAASLVGARINESLRLGVSRSPLP